MTAYTDFHYSPTGSGVISGAQVLEQTEQGINGLGQYVQDNVSGAIDTANEALTTARNADSNATAAINLANSFNAQIIAANQTAGNALTTAQSAQNTANSASSLASTANNNAATALNTANAASAGVTTLTGTVNSLGNRMTAAENAINTNAGNITTLQNGLATTNANVTAAANTASAAQATATSAQSTATLARNQAYVLRYTGTTITGGGTIAYADIDNTNNIKAGDKIIDISGAIYDLASVDTANQTVTVGAAAIIDLAVLPDLFNSANTWSENNQFAKINTIETNTVEWHNSHYRGINLISTGHFANMAALLTAIRAQDWSDIYIGDYVELTFTYEGASRIVKFYVGEIDKFYKVGDTSLNTHHLVMVTGDLGINQVMNDSNTTSGGYVGSKAHTVTLPALYAILNPLFNNAILTHREFLSNNVLSAQTVSLSLDDGNGAVTYSCNNFPLYSSGDPDTPGCVTLGDWYDCNLVLMSEIEMYGSNRFSCSGFDDVMCPDGQITAFKYNRNLQTLNRTISTWLRNVNSASRFCYYHNHGRVYRGGAAATYIRLRPRFLIG